MAGKTISTYTDTKTAESVAYLAKLEQRSPSQIAGMALKLFVSLPASARAAWCQIEALGNETDKEKLTQEISHLFLETQYQIAQRQVVEQMQVEKSIPLETEDDLLNEAISLTRDE